MIKISSIVSNIVHSSDFALEGLRTGSLNLSAYALHIKPEVEAKTHKDVTKSSIVIALSRLSKEIIKEAPLIPTVRLQTLSTTPDLFEASFGTGPNIQRKIISLQTDFSKTPDHFLSIISGLSETTIVAAASDKQYILNELKPRKPRSLVEGLGALRIGIDNKTYNTPNVLYALLKIMSGAAINIQSLTSASNEITFVVQQSDTKRAFLLLHENFVA